MDKRIRVPNFDLIKFTATIFLLIYLLCVWFFKGSGISIAKISLYFFVTFIFFAIIELIILHFLWHTLVFNKGEEKIIIQQYKFFSEIGKYEIPFKNAIFVLDPVSMAPGPGLSPTSFTLGLPLLAVKPEATSWCNLVLTEKKEPLGTDSSYEEKELTDTKVQFCLDRSSNKKRLIRKAKQFEKLIGMAIPLEDRHAEAQAQQQAVWKRKNTQNIISTCVVIGVTLIFVGVFIAGFYKKFFILLEILGVASIVFGLIYGALNRKSK